MGGGTYTCLSFFLFLSTPCLSGTWMREHVDGVLVVCSLDEDVIVCSGVSRAMQGVEGTHSTVECTS